MQNQQGQQGPSESHASRIGNAVCGALVLLGGSLVVGALVGAIVDAAGRAVSSSAVCSAVCAALG